MPKVARGFYAVGKGREAGVFETWEECEAQVKVRADAEAFVASHSSSTAAPIVSPVKPASPGSPSGRRVAPYQRSGSVPAVHPVSPSKSAPQSASLSAAKPTMVAAPKPLKAALPRAGPIKIIPWTQCANSPDVADESQWFVVYSDGACKGNGKSGAVAGVGVWFGPNDPKNISERCPGDQTNNRAELIAIIRVLETAPPTERLLIKTDSKYSIQCFTQWLPGWLKRDWKNAAGLPVKNRHVIAYLSSLLDKRSTQGENVRLQYIKAHVGHEGNEGADQLAGAGTFKPAVPEQSWEEFEKKVRAELRTMETAPENQGTIEIEGPLDLDFYAEGLVDESELEKDLDFYADGLVDDAELWRELEEA
ncbi:hypothetical protein HWV62_10230 [Athelia sp. TMB]|nr:hypothetical protein HWV62_10230 [Athelia sp. TMB]